MPAKNSPSYPFPPASVDSRQKKGELWMGQGTFEWCCKHKLLSTDYADFRRFGIREGWLWMGQGIFEWCCKHKLLSTDYADFRRFGIREG